MQKIRKHSRKKTTSVLRIALEGLESRQYLSNTIYVATTGSNSNSGSQTSPLATLQAAANVATPGTTVIVEAGTYAGFQETTSGTATAQIVFDAQSGVIIDEPNSVTADGIDLERASYVTVNGFNVTPAAGVELRSGIRSVSNTNTIISNNTITNADDWGILTGFSENVLIEKNTISDTQAQHGIYVGNSADNPEIIDNISYGNNRCGIQINSDGTISDPTLPYAQGSDGIISNALVEGNILYDDANGQGAGINFDGVVDSTIENNLIYNNQRNGIALYQVNGTEASINDTITNNTIVQNSATPIGYDAISILDGSTGAHVFNNILSAAEGTISIDPASQVGFEEDYNVVGASGFDPTGQSYGNNVSFAQWQAMGYDTHSVYVSNIDSLFVNAAAGNFQLVAGSAAIGVGNAGYAPSTDIVGNARPSSGAVDAGAYEYTTSAPTDPVAPNAPSNLTASNETTSQITLNWTDNGGDETGFEILAKTGSAAFAEVGTVAAGVTTFTSTGLAAGTSYTYEVIATGSSENSSASNTVTAQTQADPVAPNAPSNLTAGNETTSQITLNWTDNGGDETGFEILAKTGSAAFAKVGTVAAGVTTFTSTALAADTTYSYEVIATGPGGNSPASNTVTAQTQADPISPPNAASNLIAASETTSQIVLSWTDNGGDENGFEILRKSATGTFAQVGSVAAGVTTFTNTGLTAGTSYTYEVIATGPGGNSPASNTVTAQTQADPISPPNAASNLISTGQTTSEISLSWQDNGGDETGFNIMCKTGTGTFTHVVSVAPGTTTFTNTGLTAGTSYTYEIVATGPGGNAAASNALTVSTASLPVDPPPTDSTTIPAAPVLLSVTSTHRNLVTLTWTESSTDQTGFDIEELNSNGTWTVVHKTNGSATQASIRTSKAGGTYTFMVVATNAAGDSSDSNNLSVTVEPRFSHQTEPAAATVGSGQADLSWHNPTQNSAANFDDLGGTPCTPFAVIDTAVTARMHFHHRAVFLSSGLSFHGHDRSSALAT